VMFAERGSDDERVYRIAAYEGDLERVVAEQLEPLPLRYVTDSIGRVRLPVPRRHAMLVAAADGLFGYYMLEPYAEAALVLPVHADYDIVAEVVDEGGKPVSDVFVALRSKL